MEHQAARLRRAVVELSGMVEASAKDTQAVLGLVEALRRMAMISNSPADCVKYLTRACREDPYDWRLRCQLGIALIRAADAEGGLAAFDAAAELRPRNANIWFQRGAAILWQLQGVPKAKVADRAIDAFDRALELDDSLTVARIGTLVAACYAKTVKPEKHRLLKRIRGWGDILTPSPELIPFMSYLGLGMVYSVHSARSSKGLTEAAKKTHRGAYNEIVEGLRPWLDVFPREQRLDVVLAAVELLDCEDDRLADTIVDCGPRFPQRRLLHLFVHQRLKDTDPEHRVSILAEVSRRGGLGSGLGRQLLCAINDAARRAVCLEDHDKAEALWRRGLEMDPYNPALHHNLALAALHRGEGTALSSRVANAIDLLLCYWGLAQDRKKFLERLAAKFESFSIRLGKALAAALDTEDAEVDPELVAAWVGETLTHLALRGVLLAHRDGSLPPGGVREALVRYLRDLAAFAEMGCALPPELAPYMDPALTGEAPLHYDALGVSSDAPPSEIRKQYDEAHEQLTRALTQATITGEREAANRAKERLARLDEAYELLSDLDRRARYDAECIPPDEHAFHMARRQFICNLHEYSSRLVDRGQDLTQVLACAYEQVPHAGIEIYFEALQRNARTLIHEQITSLRFSSLIKRAQELMNDDQWRAALELLLIVLASGGHELGQVHYLVAVCEWRLEMEHIEAHGSVSAPGVVVKTDARQRLDALGPLEERDEGAFDAMRMLVELFQQARARGETGD